MSKKKPKIVTNPLGYKFLNEHELFTRHIKHLGYILNY